MQSVVLIKLCRDGPSPAPRQQMGWLGLIHAGIQCERPPVLSTWVNNNKLLSNIIKFLFVVVRLSLMVFYFLNYKVVRSIGVLTVPCQEAPTSKNTSAIPLYSFFCLVRRFAAFQLLQLQLAPIGTE